jgi:hypothetical protein
MIKGAYTRFREKGGSKSNQALTAALVAVQRSTFNLASRISPRSPSASLLFLKARHISADIQGYSYPRYDFHHREADRENFTFTACFESTNLICTTQPLPSPESKMTVRVPLRDAKPPPGLA